jgi:prephenate dehydrogenase
MAVFLFLTVNNRGTTLMNNISIGIIGLGSFGNFVASLLPTDQSIHITGFDTRVRQSKNITQANLATVAASDIVILAIPLTAYPEILQKLQTLLPPTTLLIDICSVKVLPEQLIGKYLSSHPNLLLTHPLFGPHTAPNDKGHEIVVTKSSGSMSFKVLSFCQDKMGLRILRVTGEEHDKVMAQVHALTFFVAESLAKMHLPPTPFSTPSYQMLTNLVQFQRVHTEELSQTIQLGNPFSRDMRKQLMKSFRQYNRTLQESTIFREGKS